MEPHTAVVNNRVVCSTGAAVDPGNDLLRYMICLGHAECC